MDEVSELAAELGIRAMPTFLFFKDGQKVEEFLGANPPALINLLKKHAPGSGDAAVEKKEEGDKPADA